MRGRAATLVGVVVAAAVAWVLVGPAGAVTTGRSTTMQSLESGVLGQINTIRRAHGLVALRISPALDAAARQHTVEMAKDGYFSHSSANGGTFDRRIGRYYPANSHYWSVGENLLWCSPNVDAVSALQMWMNSPEHRANLLMPRWREIGVSAVHVASAPGTYGGHEVTIITTDFGVRR